MNRFLAAAALTLTAAQAHAQALRIEVSLADRKVYAIQGIDTLLAADAGVASEGGVTVGNKHWNFTTPKGTYTVHNKRTNPVWIPPDWHYAETAADYDLYLDSISRTKPLPLSNGRQLVVRNNTVGILQNGEFYTIPDTLHIVYDNTLFIPPAGTKNRQIQGVLGKYSLDLGNGYMIHGTPFQSSIGKPSTHGCIRLRDEDIEWLYNNTPTGTKVYIK